MYRRDQRAALGRHTLARPDPALMIEIIVTPQGAGQFMACLGERIILKSSRQPLLDAARVLLAEGVDPQARIQMRHAGANHVALSSTVGKAAKLTVDEHNGTVFAKWKPHPVSAGSPPMRFDEEAVRCHLACSSSAVPRPMLWDSGTLAVEGPRPCCLGRWIRENNISRHSRTQFLRITLNC